MIYLLSSISSLFSFFFFNDTATTEIYTLSLHDALPIWRMLHVGAVDSPVSVGDVGQIAAEFRRLVGSGQDRSEEHTSELQSRLHLVCRLLLEKKKKANSRANPPPPF